MTTEQQAAFDWGRSVGEVARINNDHFIKPPAMSRELKPAFERGYRIGWQHPRAMEGAR